MRFGGLLYFELRHDGFSGRNPLQPRAAIATQDDVEKFPPADIATAFGHPRLMIADHSKAEQLFAKMIRPLISRDLIKPILILRIQHRFAETVTPVEVRSLFDCTRRAGARRVYLWFGRELSDDEIIHFRFPPEGLVLRDVDQSDNRPGK